MAGWQLGRTTKNHCAGRVHYLSLLSRQLLPAEWSVMSVGVIDRSIPEILVTARVGNQSHLGHLDICEEGYGDGANFCIFVAENDRESERNAMVFIADSTPPPALCPRSNGSAVLKTDVKNQNIGDM